MTDNLPIWSQPLAHFLFIGAAIFALGAIRGEAPVGDDKVVVSLAQIERMAAVFEKTWGRAPGDEELQRLVQDHIREEIYNRDFAVDAGLDRDIEVLAAKAQ